MTWSYDVALPRDLDKVRLLLGDLDEADQQFSDEELDYFLTLGGVFAAVATGARALQSRYSRYNDFTVGGGNDLLTISYRRRVEHYAELALTYEAKSTALNGLPFAGGISVADKTTREQDTDRVAPSFTLGLHDDPPRRADTTTTP